MSQGDFDDFDFEFDNAGWDELDRLLSPSSPEKSDRWKRRQARPESPATPVKGRLGLRSSDDLSPVKRGSPAYTLALSQNMDNFSIGDEYELDDETPVRQRLFVSEKTNVEEPDETEGSDVEVENLLITDVFKAPRVPSRTQMPPPLQPSSTQSSIESTLSCDSLLPNQSRTSSSSSLWSDNCKSPRKRAPDLGDLSPSPAKCRRLSPPPKAPFSLSESLGEAYGSALPVHIIAHSNEVQKHFDNAGVELGVQWELARGICTGRWTWEHVEAVVRKRFDAFVGTNSQVAPHVSKIMRGQSRGTDSRDLGLWNEIDREHAALKEGKGRGLGTMQARWESSSWEGRSPYYGGQIRYPLRLVKCEGTYSVRLEKPQKGRSFRLARVLGSANVLQISIPLKLVREEATEVRQFLSQKFVLNGRIYMAIPPKDMSSMYLVQTNEAWDKRKPLHYFADNRRISFDDLLKQHNPLDVNAQQPFAKYTARFALGLSTSRPVLEFDPENIIYDEDILADGWDSAKKPPSEKIMTDGCGFINRAALMKISELLGYDSLPTAVQGRINGSKGLWVIHPYDQDPDAVPRIWIRGSQRKIKLHGDEPVHRIFDLLRASHPSETERRYELSEQSIQCLSANGVPDEVLVELLVDGLTQTVGPLLEWGAGSAAMVALWRAVDRAGSVSSSRMQRIAGSRSRALGFRGRDREDADAFEDVDVMIGGVDADADNDDLRASDSGRDQGGGPSSLYEKTIELIQAGFHPAMSKYLNDKLRYIVKCKLTSAVDKLKISLPESTASDAFVIPDPLGVLKEGEIFYRSSKPMKNPRTQTLFETLVGPVILGRYPIRLPCDMQMVTAVDIPELHDWPDVIIAPTVGQRSLLSILSGGDYDGDTVIFIWLEAFCQNFANKPFTPPPDGLIEDHFEQDVKTVDEVITVLRGMDPNEAQLYFQELLLIGLRDSKVGLYSIFHDNAIHHYGYDHPNSILMAYMGNTLLDAGKTGLQLKPEILKTHEQKFGASKTRPRRHGKRDPGKPSILQQLTEAGQRKGDELLREFDRLSGKLQEDYQKIELDVALLKPYKDAKAKSTGIAGWTRFYQPELEAIERHVEATFREYSRVNGLGSHQKRERVTIILEVHNKFTEPIQGIGLMGTTEVEEIKASYAYSRKEEFGFEVAFTTLCTIKARAMRGGIAPSCRTFDELKTISNSAARATQDDE